MQDPTPEFSPRVGIITPSTGDKTFGVCVESIAAQDYPNIQHYIVVDGPMHEAKVRGESSVSVWGSGNPRRELLHSDDMAAACVRLSGIDDADFDRVFEQGALAPLINIGYGSDLSIAELATTVAAAVGFTGRLEFDRSRPDGTPQKLLDSSRIRALGWTPATSFDDGIRLTYADFLATHGGHPAGARHG